jgi:hypothetical protein
VPTEDFHTIPKEWEHARPIIEEKLTSHEMRLRQHSLDIARGDLAQSNLTGLFTSQQNLLASFANLLGTMDSRVEKLGVLMWITICGLGVGLLLGLAILYKLPVK